jgi:hypothetical protein
MQRQTMREPVSQFVQAMAASEDDGRIALVLLMGRNLQQAQCEFFSRLEPARQRQLVVFSVDAKPVDWPGELRFRQVAEDELADAPGCLCCSMRSELPTALSHLFLGVLRRQVPAVQAVALVTQANSAQAIEATLRHAPFLRQRYRLAACLPADLA